MKKKTLLITGLAILGLAAGAASYAVATGLPGITLTAGGDEEEYASPVVKWPAKDSYVLVSSEVTEIYMEFASDVVLSTDDKLEVSMWSANSSGAYKKQGAWPITDKEHVYVDGKRLYIKFDEPLAANNYYIDVPEGCVTVNGLPNAGTDHSLASKAWLFYVVNPVNPAPDSNGISYPLPNSTVSSSADIKSLWLNFATGDKPIDINRECQGNVVIKKGEEVLYTFSATDTNITTDRKWPGHLVINLPEALEAGEYTVDVPQSLVEASGISAAYSWSFTVQGELPYEISLKSGGTYSFAQIEKVTISWPEGTTVKLNAGVKVQLTNFVSGGSKVLTDYSAEVNGNVVTLTANSPKAIVVANKTANYLNLLIPKGFVTISKDGSSYSSSEMDVTNIFSSAFTAADFKITPALDTPGLTINDLQEITIEIPEGSEYCGGEQANKTVLTLYSGTFTGSSYPTGTYSYIYRFKSLSADGKKIVTELAPQGASTSTTNNRDIMQAGPTTLTLSTNIVCLADDSTKKNGVINIPSYVVKGIEIAPIYDSTPSDQDGVSSISSLSLKFPKKVVVAEGEAEITLTRNGSVVASCQAGETTQTNAKPDGSGSINVTYNDLFKIDGKDITAPGVYVFHIPEGAFKQVAEPQYLNAETEITVMICENTAYSVSPIPATFSGNVNKLVCTPGEELDELTSITLIYPEGATIELSQNYENLLAVGGAGLLTANKLLEKPMTATPTVTSDNHFGSAKIEGNKITFTLTSPYRTATAPNYGTCFYVPQGTFTVTIPDGPNAGQYVNATIVECYQGMPMYQGRLGVIALNSAGRADIQYMNANDDYILASALDHLIYTGYQALYPNATTPEAQLINAETNEVIAHYVGKVPAEDLYLSSLSIDFTPDAGDADKVAALGNGKYKFVVAAKTLQGGSSSNDALFTFNEKAFTYEFSTLDTEWKASIADGESIEQFSDLSISFTGVNSLQIVPDVKPVVFYKKLRTEGVWAGEGIYDNVDLTTEGYTVELTPVAGEENSAVKLTVTPTIETPETYYVHFPAGALLLDGNVKSPSIDLQYVVIEMAEVKDIFSPLMPESFDFDISESYGADEDDLTNAMGMGQIALAGKGVTLINNSEAKAQLQFKGETIAEIGVWGGDEKDMTGIIARSTDLGTTFMFSFATEPEAKFLKGGQYTLVLPSGLFKYATDKEEMPVKAGELVYNMTVPTGPVMEFANYVKRCVPASEEFTDSQSFYGIAGMSIISLYTIPGVKVNTDCESKLQLIYKGEDGTSSTVIAEVLPSEGMEFMDVQPFDLYDEEPAKDSQLMVRFGDYFDSLFHVTGCYSVVIPEGALEIDDSLIGGATLDYKLLPQESKEYTWTITPVDGTEFERKIGGEIVLTVDGKITYEGNSVGGLYGPDGQALKFKSNTPKGYYTNSLTWTLEENPKSPIKWIDGTYQFRIQAYTLWIDSDEEYTEANFPKEDIVVSYILKDGDTTGVAMIGVEPADSYNVYTLDGKVVLLNADSDKMVDLAPGMYIINGKKAMISK